jgi:putative salt-induced outer membrane protein YdiY
MRFERCAVGLLLLQLVSLPKAFGQEEEKKLGWADQAELAFVLAAGNSETSTLGFRNVLSRIWEDAEFHFELAGLRTETATITRTPVGLSADDFVIEESKVSALTAENYLARAKYDRNLSPRLYAYGSGGWDRDEFAGVRNRYYGAGGVGNIWYDRENLRWRTDYGLSVTHEEPTVGSGDTFAGIRLSSDFLRQLTGNTSVENLTIANENLEDGDDLRIDSLTALAVSMVEHLAIKLSLRLLYDNVPSFTEVPLQLPGGAVTAILVPVQADKLDTRFALAVVVDF